MVALPHFKGPSDKAETRPIRVVLVDDSNVVRAIFARVLGQSGQVKIVGEAADSAAAVRLLGQVQADIILLDIEMPHRSGLDALPEILDAANGARVMVVSSFVEENGPAAIRALELGACDTLSKPGRFGFAGRFPELLVEKVVRLGSSARVVPMRHQDGGAIVLPDQLATKMPECIAIGASTGGIPVIFEIVSSLSPKLDCPIFIAQHLPDAFMEFFARQLAAHTDRSVSVPSAGTVIQQGHIYVSPASAHLICRQKGNTRIIDHLDYYPGSRYSPSVDALLESVAEVYGETALALVLSGMGNDGAAGARQLASKKARIIVQDAESSVVWGMPGAIAKAGMASAILPPAHLTRFLAKVAAS